MESESEQEESCELCGRTGVMLTAHHLIPKDEGGAKGSRVMLCRACHSQIHATFSNKELSRYYNTIERIRADERMEKFLRWVKKQSPEKKIRVYRNRR